MIMTAPPTLEQQIAACAEAAEIAEHAGEWDTSQRLAAAAETLRALVPRLIEPVRTGAAMNPRWEALRAAAMAATPGPWTIERQDANDGSIYYAIHGEAYEWITNTEESKVNAEHIAAASPSEVLALLDALAAAEAKLDKWAEDYRSLNETLAQVEDDCEAAEARAARLEAAHDSLFEERGRLRKALFELYNLLAVLKFEPDEGQPHPLKDGVADRIMASANRMLQDAALSAQEDAGNGR